MQSAIKPVDTESHIDDAGRPDRGGLGPCFDPRLAGFPTLVLRIDELSDIYQVTHAAERVDEYRAAMIRGAKFPPISVVRLGGRFFVANGHKRLNAYRALGYRMIVVERWPVRRWLKDQTGQALRNIRVQWVSVTRGLLMRGERERGAEVMRHYAQHWKRIIASIRGRVNR